MGSEQKSPLYERLGGVYPIATVIDDFIEAGTVEYFCAIHPQMTGKIVVTP